MDVTKELMEMSICDLQLQEQTPHPAAQQNCMQRLLASVPAAEPAGALPVHRDCLP